ncbi:RodZ domain-containing protein [Microbulbifer aggregans]|uniref:RodZ domain-containing protein n=1 Tax=Microbulbifer aggregans TaxID=1769779 RepID=UPI001CFCDE47|nr:RodZ domain-containing protein [Microbulbifer aggregans]
MNNVDAAAATAAEQVEAAATMTAGRLITSAREAAGLTREELARRMCMTPHKLEHLEQDDFERLAGATYVRGYIRNTCKELGVDPQPVLEAFERQLPTPVEGAAQSRKPSGPVIAKGGQSSSGGLSSLVFVTALVAAGGGYWWFNQQSGATSQVPVASVESPATEEQAVSSEPQVEAWQALDAVDNPEEASEVVEHETVAEEPSGIAVAPEVESPILEEGALDTDAQLDVASDIGEPSEPVVEPEQAELPERAATDLVVSSPAPAQQPAAQVTVQTATRASQEVVSDAESRVAAADVEALLLDFTEEAWVEVTDASGNKLLAKLQPAGSRVELTGEAPFSLMLGNAAGTTVSYRGQVVDSAPLGNRRTRKLTVGG